MAGIGDIQRMRDNVKSIERNIGAWCRDAVNANMAKICELNSEEQLYKKGETSTGVSIDTYQPYRPLTIQIKTEKGQPTDRVTLNDTGDFYESFVIFADEVGFEIDATDWKRGELVDKYGEEIFGLNEENRQKVAREILLPELINKINETLWH